MHASTPRRRDLATTRAALLDAAAQVFAQRGVAAASLEEIATTAGFTRGALYHHFDSKDELVIALLTRHDEQLLRAYEDLLGSPAPDPIASARRWRALHADDEATVSLRLELRYHALRNPEVRKRLVEAAREAIAATAERLRAFEAESGRRWRYPVEQVAALSHLVSHAALEQQLLDGADATPIMELLQQLIWDGGAST